MADLVMRKRPAMHAGELGLFIDSEVFEEEFASIKQGTDVSVEAKQSRNLKQMRLAWGLCRKIADSGALGDADTREVMNYLLKKAKHVKYIANQHRDGVEVEVIVKSIRFASMDQTAFDRLFNRMIYIVTSEIIPDVPAGVLRDEIEKMSGVTAPEPKAPPKRRRRTAEEIATAAEARQLPPPVSVIPDHDPVTGEVIDEIPATEPVSTAVQGQPNPPAPTPTEGAGTVPPADAAPPAPASAKPASPSPAAQVGGATPATIPEPTNFKTWAVWCKAWLDAAVADTSVSDMDVLGRWSGETKVRNNCGITSEERAENYAYMHKVVERKREQQAKRQA